MRGRLYWRSNQPVNRRKPWHPHWKSLAAARSRAGSLNPDGLFTPEDLTDEQRLFGRTAAEFMRKEMLPNQAHLHAHDWAKTRELF